MIHELRMYDVASMQHLAALNTRFGQVTLGIFEKYGIQQLGFWTPQVGETSLKLMYMLEFESLTDRDKKWVGFTTDPDWIAARNASNAAVPGGTVTSRISSAILQPTVYSPLVADRAALLARLQPQAGRVYEWREYEMLNTAHAAFFHTWFADKTLPLFNQHGFVTVGLWDVVIGQNAPKVSMLLAFDSLAHREQAWASIGADTLWAHARAELDTTFDRPILARLGNSILAPTAYSALR